MGIRVSRTVTASFVTIALIGTMLLAATPQASAQAVAFDSGHSLSSNGTAPIGLVPADLNKDGKMDLVESAQGTSATWLGSVRWYENTGGTPATFTEHDIDASANGTTSVAVADLNGDGDLDIVASAFNVNTVRWYESNGANPPGFTTHTVSTTLTGARSVATADIDGDGHVDIIAAGQTTVVWYKSDGGSPPAFGTAKTIQGGLTDVRQVTAADMDQNGVPDVLYADDAIPLIRWNENTATVRALSTWSSTAHDVGPSGQPAAPWTVAAADMNADGRVDVVSATSTGNGVRVFLRNNTAPTTFTYTNTAVGDTITNPRSVAVADFDGDGDPDIAVAGFGNTTSPFAGGSVAWEENDGATPTPGWHSHVVTTSLLGPRTIVASDLDGDTNPDLAVASVNDNGMTHFSNLRPMLAVNDVSVNENDGTAQFTVTATGTLTDTISVTAQTVNGTATSPSDYTATGPTVLNIPVGQSTATFNVPITNDGMVESDETFRVDLSNAVNAGITDGSGTATIHDDDTLPPGVSAVTVNDPSVLENGTETFTITASPAPTTDITLTAQTQNGSAQAPDDYSAFGPATVTIPANQTSATVSIPTAPDNIDEPDEVFSLNLSSPSSNANITDPQGRATIVDDDPTPVLSVNDASVTEGGTLDFLITATNPSWTAMDVSYATSDGTADSSDYTPANGLAIIPAGSTSTHVFVATTQDSSHEPDETLNMVLSDPQDATLSGGDAVETGTIVDDDAAPTISISSYTHKEGKRGHTPFPFVVTLSAPSGRQVTVHFTTTNGTAIAGKDYAASTADLVFAPGETTKTVTIAVMGDTRKERTETFTVDLSAPTDATIATASGLGTIRNDDH